MNCLFADAFGLMTETESHGEAPVLRCTDRKCVFSTPGGVGGHQGATQLKQGKSQPKRIITHPIGILCTWEHKQLHSSAAQTQQGRELNELLDGWTNGSALRVSFPCIRLQHLPPPLSSTLIRCKWHPARVL